MRHSKHSSRLFVHLVFSMVLIFGPVAFVSPIIAGQYVYHDDDYSSSGDTGIVQEPYGYTWSIGSAGPGSTYAWVQSSAGTSVGPNQSISDGYSNMATSSSSLGWSWEGSGTPPGGLTAFDFRAEGTMYFQAYGEFNNATGQASSNVAGYQYAYGPVWGAGSTVFTSGSVTINPERCWPDMSCSPPYMFDFGDVGWDSYGYWVWGWFVWDARWESDYENVESGTYGVTMSFSSNCSAGSSFSVQTQANGIASVDGYSEAECRAYYTNFDFWPQP